MNLGCDQTDSLIQDNDSQSATTQRKDMTVCFIGFKNDESFSDETSNQISHIFYYIFTFKSKIIANGTSNDKKKP